MPYTFISSKKIKIVSSFKSNEAPNKYFIWNFTFEQSHGIVYFVYANM